MGGGDSRVQFRDPNMVRGAQQNRHAETIDANSVMKGNMTEERTVDKQKYYFTAEGAKAFDALEASQWEVTGSKDPGWFSGGPPAGEKGEQHPGKV